MMVMMGDYADGGGEDVDDHGHDDGVDDYAEGDGGDKGCCCVVDSSVVGGDVDGGGGDGDGGGHDDDNGCGKGDHGG